MNFDKAEIKETSIELLKLLWDVVKLVVIIQAFISLFQNWR